MKNLILLLTVLTFLFSCKSNPKEEYDICIYGGTSAGVIAAYSAKMLDKKVLLIEPQSRLGGLTSDCGVCESWLGCRMAGSEKYHQRTGV